MLGLFQSSSEKLAGIVKQFTDAVEGLTELKEEINKEIGDINEEQSRLVIKKDVAVGTLERTDNIINGINENILGVK